MAKYTGYCQIEEINKSAIIILKSLSYIFLKVGEKSAIIFLCVLHIYF